MVDVCVLVSPGLVVVLVGVSVLIVMGVGVIKNVGEPLLSQSKGVSGDGRANAGVTMNSSAPMQNRLINVRMDVPLREATCIFYTRSVNLGINMSFQGVFSCNPTLEIPRKGRYGKILGRMINVKNPGFPAPPNLITSLRAGFDAIANHVVVILLPLTLDLFIWLGPHIQIKTVILDVLAYLTASPAWEATQNTTGLEDNLVILQDFAARVNLVASLRSFPVGVSSLMAVRLPIDIPGGQPFFWDITNPWAILLIGLTLFILGLGAGSLYFSLVSQAALSSGVHWQQALIDWPRFMLNVLSLTLALLIILLIMSIPSGCVFSLLSLGGLSLGQVGILLYLGVVLWLAFPLIFTPHGIFANHLNVVVAARKSIRVTRMTLPTTSLLFLVILVLNEGMNILWRIPAEDSWIMLIGIAGHAFITTALLAATFVYYRDADRWVQEMLAKFSGSVTQNRPSV